MKNWNQDPGQFGPLKRPGVQLNCEKAAEPLVSREGGMEIEKK